MQGTDILFSLGSNLGDRKKNLETAISKLTENNLVESLKISSFFETEPYGYVEQPWFLNIAAFGTTKATTLEMLERCKSIETEIGRVKRNKWHEREIDIDIVFFGNTVLNTEKLVLPHPSMHLRRFVLLPSVEIAAGFVHPVFGKTIAELERDCKDNSTVKIYK
jgi:2-amino-4-hydroxy-6-hydroxymethyldihydropteridine diphosphokinase